MFPSTLNLNRFEPNNELRLKFTGFNWRIIPRGCLTLFFIPFVVGPLIFPIVALTTLDSIPKSIGLKHLFISLFMILFFIFWYASTGFMSYFSSLIFSNWSDLKLSKEDGTLQATYSGYCFWGWQNHEIPLRDINKLNVNVSKSNDEDLATTIKIHHSNGEPLRVNFRVSKMDQTEEVMALCFAMANIIGLSEYETLRSDHLETQFEIGNSLSGEETEPVPTIDSKLNFSEQQKKPSMVETQKFQNIREPEIDLKPFDPEEYVETIPGMTTPTFEWNPGEKVIIEEQPMDWKMKLPGALFVGIIAGIVLPNFFGGIINGVLSFVGFSLSYVSLGIVIGLVGAAVTWYRLNRQYRHRRSTFDWNEETAEFKVGATTQRVEFDDVEKFIVKGIRNQHKSGDTHETRYQAELQVKLPNTTKTILISGEDEDPETTYQLVGSLAEDLAESIGTTWEWKGYAGGHQLRISFG